MKHPRYWLDNLNGNKIMIRGNHDKLLKNGIEVLFDDRSSMSAGEKFADADLLGIPYRAVESLANQLRKHGIAPEFLYPEDYRNGPPSPEKAAPRHDSLLEDIIGGSDDELSDNAINWNLMLRSPNGIR